MTTSLKVKRYLNPTLHVLAWALLGFLLLFYIPLTWNVRVPMVFWIWQSLVLVLMIAVFYVNARIIVPQTIIKNKTIPFLIWLLAITIFFQLVADTYITYTGMRHKMASILNDKVRREHIFDSFIFTITLIVLGISTSLTMLQNWQKVAQRHQQLEQDKTVAELAMLKNQMNPHFFFNTLNNIYSLTYINADNAREALHTLSRMMRYLLYSTEDEKTSLLKEVSFLRDYIALMRLRTDDRLKILLDFPEKINDEPIAPMLLLPFVENAFKHGVDATMHSEIKIRLAQEDGQLELGVVNNIFNGGGNHPAEGGIGLSNTRRRLELIYPQKHALLAGINNHGDYEVNLSLELNA